MATEGRKELLTSGSEPENVENDLYNDVNITAILTTGEKKGDTALEDDKMAEVVNVNAVQETAAEISKADEVRGNDAENDKKVEAVNSSPNKETKKILRKRKNNAEEASAHNVSSSPMTAKRKMNDASAMKMKEVALCDKSTEGNGKKEVNSDGQLESIEKDSIPEDEVEKADSKDVKVGKKVEGAVNKSVKVAKKKIVANVKGGSSNAESAPTKSPNVAAVEDTCGIEENAEQNIQVDENHASATENATPTIEKKDAEGTKDKPSPSASRKHLKKDGTAEKKMVDGMGLIFMCNAKTKKDCFKYNVFGLPESKKALVAKIYKGMRLFLFDFDLKLLYGIYKAAGPGGYNIEPKAFNSKFPSQVRFTILRDCLPLPEEKFKIAMKENYVRNKFDCQLSAEQVRKLCKLFQNPTSIISRPRAGREVIVPSSRTRERREAYPLPPPRVLRLSPPPRALPLHTIPRPLPAAPLLPPSYTYERPADDYFYRREHHRVLDLEMRPRELPIIDYHDPYNPYREPVLYRDPAYPPTLPAAAYTARLREPRSPPRYLY